MEASFTDTFMQRTTLGNGQLFESHIHIQGSFYVVDTSLQRTTHWQDSREGQGAEGRGQGAEGNLHFNLL